MCVCVYDTLCVCVCIFAHVVGVGSSEVPGQRSTRATSAEEPACGGPGGGHDHAALLYPRPAGLAPQTAAQQAAPGERRCQVEVGTPASM